MQLLLYPRLSTRSKRALTKKYHRGSQRHAPGELVNYNPRARLIERLMRETGMSFDQVVKQLSDERKYLLSQNEI